MRVALATLCDRLEPRDDGRVDIIGAAPDLVQVAGFPWQGRLTFALVLELGPDDDRSGLGMNVSVVRASDGEVVGQVDPASAKQQREVPTDVAGPVHTPFELGLDVTIPAPDVYAVLVRNTEGQTLAHATLAVQRKA